MARKALGTSDPVQRGTIATVNGPHAFALVVPVEPTPTPRPRVARFGVYYPKNYKLFLDRLEASFPAPLRPGLTGDLYVEVESICRPLKASKFSTPMGDVDNLAKAVLDMMTKLDYWQDDRQIVTLKTSKRFPREGENSHYRIYINEALP